MSSKLHVLFLSFNTCTYRYTTGLYLIRKIFQANETMQQRRYPVLGMMTIINIMTLKQQDDVSVQILDDTMAQLIIHLSSLLNFLHVEIHSQIIQQQCQQKALTQSQISKVIQLQQHVQLQVHILLQPPPPNVCVSMIAFVASSFTAQLGASY